jgi:hypothetical protein
MKHDCTAFVMVICTPCSDHVLGEVHVAAPDCIAHAVAEGHAALVDLVFCCWAAVLGSFLVYGRV